MERELEEVGQKIAPLETNEEEEYYQRRREYRDARRDYENRVRNWEDEKRENSREAEAERERTVRRMYRKVRTAFGPEPAAPTTEVHWRFLPPGEVSDEDLLSHYGYQQRRHPHVRYDMDRIKKALLLGPNGRWVERDRFGDYIVFTYPFTSSALMECPIVGNAIYVLHSDPKRWSGTPKKELMAETDRGGPVARILHQGDWFEKVKKELGAE